MGEVRWEAVLPGLFKTAGIDAASGFTIAAMAGGVSSDIVRIDLGDGRVYCAKRALPRLKVASDWQVPLERNHYEVAWLRRAGAIMRGAVPRVLGEDLAQGVALLEYLPPAEYALWKDELLAGRADPAVPVALAGMLGRIHAATLGDIEVAAEFPTDALFDALRLDPYLRFTAARHTDIGPQILAVIEQTATTKLALVHGDVSPKNILVSRTDGHPVLLDAECAWFGDPAFDGAFLINHLLLKAIHLPLIRTALLGQARAFAAEWLEHLPVGFRPGVEARTAALLPCLMLARVDGKSPVEYLSDANRMKVRHLAASAIAEVSGSLDTAIARLGG